MIDLKVDHGGTQLKDFLSALVKPLQTNTDLLLSFETGEKKRAIWNGQKIVLQAALNDIFGITSAPFIYIQTNLDLADYLFFYGVSESDGFPVYFYPSPSNPVYFFGSSETVTPYDFTVFIPTGIYTAELDRQVKAQVNLYKLAGKRFITATY